MKTLTLLILILMGTTIDAQHYLETGVFYSKTLKEWVNIDDIQAITDIDSVPILPTGIYIDLPDEQWTHQGQYFFILKYKRGEPAVIYQREHSEAIRLHNDFLSIWKKYKIHQNRLT